MSKEREGTSIDANNIAARGEGRGASTKSEGGKQQLNVQPYPKGATSYSLQASARSKGGMQTGGGLAGGAPHLQVAGQGLQQYHQAGRHVQQQGSLHNNNNNMATMSVSNVNTSTPCAACKLLRRRCAQECPFAPYFSPHEPQRFASVHKIYGASNVSKMLLEVPEMQRADAANSLVYEANARLRDPVYGCMGVVSTLQQQAQALQAELNVVKGEMMRYKACQQVQEVHALQQLPHNTVYNNPAMPTTPPLDHHPPISIGHPLPTTNTLGGDHYLASNTPTSTTSHSILLHATPLVADNSETKERLMSWP